MSIGDLEQQIEDFVSDSGGTDLLQSIIVESRLEVIKYMPAEYLDRVLVRNQLYASERAGFTWGDAVYVAPLSHPFTTMMYGQVGVAGEFDVSTARFFNGSDAAGIALYQKWIQHQEDEYRDLTTTVHANAANRELRNAFRTRFQIDCVYFRPDETCPSYINAADDSWFAITHWNPYRAVGSGFTSVVQNLRWCVVVPDAFKQDGRGYNAYLHDTITRPQSFVFGHYSSLESDIRAAYQTRRVVICDFK